MALILRNGGSQSPDRWLKEPRNNQYHYDVTDKVFEKASRQEDRKQEKDKSHEKKSVLEKLEEKKDKAKATIGAKKTSYRDAVSL